MSSFGSSSFKVVIDDKFFPGVFMDSDGINRYAATAFFASRAQLVTMLDYVAVVTPKRALGTKNIVLHIDVGTTHTLTVPGHSGQAYVYTAALVKCEPKGYAPWGTFYMADLEFAISSDVTP